MPTVIKGQPTSKEVRDKLKAEGKPVLLAFSCGKDSLAAWIALKNDGIPVVPAYMYYVPGMQFIEDQIARYEDHFQTEIRQYPHPMLFKWLEHALYQAPERLATIASANMPSPSYPEVWDMIAADFGLEDSWRADGVRASDSIVRRASFVKHGVMKPMNKKVSPIADWLKGEVMEAIEADRAPLSEDYAVFGRSFDGCDYRFTGPLKEHYPKDYELLQSWFPMLDVDHMRWERGAV